MCPMLLIFFILVNAQNKKQKSYHTAYERQNQTTVPFMKAQAFGSTGLVIYPIPHIRAD